MVRRRCIKRLFVLFMATMALLIGIKISEAWHSAHHSDQSTAYYTTNTLSTGNSLGADGVTNGSLNVREFLVEYEKYCSSQLIPKSSNVVVVNATDGATPVSSWNLCPCVPHTLVGRTKVTFDAPELAELERQHTELSLGGSWTPQSCIARHRVAIIIPFRDRQRHLRILLANLHPMLQRQMLEYTVFVVEQKEPAVFNKASLMNVAFVEACAFADFDCFIFHDVDMLPEDDRNFYVCSPQPRHVGSHVDKWNYVLFYADIFGGVTALKREHFERANGFSNKYYGWGGEDDDFSSRIRWQNMTIVRFTKEVARYVMIQHTRDVGNPLNPSSYIAWTPRPDDYAVDGLNSLSYKLIANESRPLYTWLQVQLPPPPTPA